MDPGAMVTHKFPLEKYKEALVCAHEQKTARAIKVAFEYPEKRGTRMSPSGNNGKMDAVVFDFSLPQTGREQNSRDDQPDRILEAGRACRA